MKDRYDAAERAAIKKILLKAGERAVQPIESQPQMTDALAEDGAHSWQDYGFDAAGVKAWVEEGRCYRPNTAAALRDASFTPREVGLPAMNAPLPKEGEESLSIGESVSLGHIPIGTALGQLRERRGYEIALLLHDEALGWIRWWPSEDKSQARGWQAVADEWERQQFAVEDVRKWVLEAKCLLAGPAAELRAAGVTPEQASLPAEGHNPKSLKTIGYAVAEKAMTCKAAVALVKTMEAEPDVTRLARMFARMKIDGMLSESTSAQPYAPTAQEWIQHGFTPEEAKDWVKKAKCMEPSTAAELRSDGVTPDMASHLVPDEPQTRFKTPGTKTIAQKRQGGEMTWEQATRLAFLMSRPAQIGPIATVLAEVDGSVSPALGEWVSLNEPAPGVAPAPGAGKYSTVLGKMVPEDREAAIGLYRERAKDWIARGFKSDDVRAWALEAGCYSPAQARDLQQAGITPQEASRVVSVQIGDKEFSDKIGHFVADHILSVSEAENEVYTARAAAQVATDPYLPAAGGEPENPLSMGL